MSRYPKSTHAIVAHAPQQRQTNILCEKQHENKFHKYVKTHPKKGKAVGVVHFSDLHFNELVSLPNNKFDFKVASKRIKRHIQAAKSYFSTQHITNVVVALTGDLINSDRRLDELLTNSTNRAQAVFIATDILQQAIIDLNQSYNLSLIHI